MEIFIVTVLTFTLILNIGAHLVTYIKMKKYEKDVRKMNSRLLDGLDDQRKSHIEIYMKIDSLDRSMQPLKDTLENAKPMKSNNWDSVRSAFKGPTRVEVNERN